MLGWARHVRESRLLDECIIFVKIGQGCCLLQNGELGMLLTIFLQFGSHLDYEIPLVALLLVPVALQLEEICRVFRPAIRNVCSILSFAFQKSVLNIRKLGL